MLTDSYRDDSGAPDGTCRSVSQDKAPDANRLVFAHAAVFLRFVLPNRLFAAIAKLVVSVDAGRAGRRCLPEVTIASEPAGEQTRRGRMGKGLLYRWFRDLSIAPKLYFTVGIMGVLIGLELFALVFALHTLSSLRAYVGGEGLWSKAQKDAAFHLYKYGVSQSDQDYQLFQAFMRVPLGDARTRQELMTGNVNHEAARLGFLAGRNHPDDIDGMIGLFLHFSDVYYIKRAIEIWGRAQDIVMQLVPLGEALHQEINAPTPSRARIQSLLAALDRINLQITASEDEFSYTLGEGSRWLERVVLRLLLITALTVETTGLLLIFSVSRGIQKGLRHIIGAANAFSTGELDARATVMSRDEIGVVASAFNDMADKLEARVVELDRVNSDLQHEVEERERAETALRGMNETLEIYVAERTATLTRTVEALHQEAANREQAEAALRQAQKMEAVGQLTGGIAHDFNNMLASISGNLELMQLRAAQGRTAGLDRYIDAALGSTSRAGALTHRLLAFSRRQTLAPKLIDMSRMMQGMEDLFRNTLGAAIRVETRQSPEVWLTFCDPNQLESALLNLVINARDAMPDGGSLSIETGTACLADRPSGPVDEQPDLPAGDYVTLSVTDTGIGMTAEVLSRAFDPFYTTKPIGQGTGLGLSMVYGFVRQSGGEVLLRSGLGLGTTVTIYLPGA